MSQSCSNCSNKPAQIHVAEMTEREGKKAWEFQHVCEDCARELGLPPSKHIDAMLQLAPLSAAPGKVEPSCTGCGLRFSEFRRNGRIGCEQCYQAFHEVLKDVLEKAHAGKMKHVGRGPGSEGAERAKREDLAALHRKLKAAVENEAYEEAARLRDRIKTLEEKKD